ncbi:hypothetical protein [Vibrio cholerae]|uniref:hypothetical protein n=1 Tax=Vibrio cholerae TaxID=666 RepID=UPI001E5C12E2|nr:hypothetical protein [Vibrio cholerae]
MKATSDIGHINPRHHFFIGPHGPDAEAFAHIAIELDCPFASLMYIPSVNSAR